LLACKVGAFFKRYRTRHHKNASTTPSPTRAQQIADNLGSMLAMGGVTADIVARL
jgi:hypothetical protein